MKDSQPFRHHLKTNSKYIKESNERFSTFGERLILHS